MSTRTQPRDGRSRLEEAYQRRGLVLVLGAGVSCDSQIPMWRDLLERVYADLHQGLEPQAELAKMTAPEFASLLEERTARDVNDPRKQRRDFAASVQRALYGDFDWELLRAIDAKNARQFVRVIEKRNPTLQAVSAMCVRQGVKRFEPNPRIKAVVTFNLDNLLQAHSRAKYSEAYELHPSGTRCTRFVLRTVERPSASSRMDKISIYHMHGMIRFDKRMDDATKHAPDQMVLTEQDFFDAFNEPTSIFTYTFLHLLREHSALFIGLSMHDENLRRLLHYSKRERTLAFEAEGETDPEKIKWGTRRHVALLKTNGDADVDRAYEETLGPLGVHVIWMHDHSQITDELAKIYGPREAWNQVSD